MSIFIKKGEKDGFIIASWCCFNCFDRNRDLVNVELG